MKFDLAQRLMRLPAFRPTERPGLRIIHPVESGCYRVTDRVGLGHMPVMGSSPMFAFEDGVPDLNDPATEGVLAEWARVLCEIESLHVAAIPGVKAPGGGPLWTVTNGWAAYMLFVDGARVPITEECRGAAWAQVIIDRLEDK